MGEEYPTSLHQTSRIRFVRDPTVYIKYIDSREYRAKYYYADNFLLKIINKGELKNETIHFTTNE